MTSTVESKNMPKSSSSFSNVESKVILECKKVECSICTDDVYQRKIVTCSFCRFEACLSCVETFLLGIDDDRPRCMNPECKKVWTFEFLCSKFPPSFHNKKYRDRRADLLLQRERSLLPGTQPLVASEKRRNKYTTLISDLMDENAMYSNLIHQNKMKIRVFRNKIDEKKEEKEEKKERIFNRACPVTDCRGFLSTSYKCGICDGYACKDCLTPKNSRDDKEHECNPDLVATVKLLANDTKPCPSCATLIFKIDGCFTGDTKIPLWSGEFKEAKDIDIGDELIGDDGTKRTVNRLMSGEDDMYEVKQNNADKYIVNSQHDLVLKKLGEPDTLIIKVNDFMDLPESKKALLYGFRSSGTLGESKKVSIDPYILGSWLGYGTASQPNITGDDTEVLEYWRDWARDNDAELVHTQKYRFSIRRFGRSVSRLSVGHETSETCRGCSEKKSDICNQVLSYTENREMSGKITNPLTDLLKQYNLVNNKHIPLVYMTNDIETRLSLLAGIIDTDGHVCNNGKRISIVQINPGLSTQIASLSRSLGFVTNVRLVERKQVKFTGSEELKDCSYKYKINISGQISKIPTKILRKKCSDSNHNKDYMRTSIKVSFMGKGLYYGWVLDGNHRFVLADYTVVKNCDQMYCTQCHTAFSWTHGTIERGVIHNPHFYAFQRDQNGGIAPLRQPVMRCGGPPHIWDVSDKLLSASDNEIFKDYENAHRLIHHINQVELQHYPNNVGPANNSNLRVDYLLNRITEKQWISKLKLKMKKQEKNTEFHMVLVMFTSTLSDLFDNIVACDSFDLQKIIDIITTVETLRVYTNKSLKNIGLNYENIYPYISEKFIYWPNFNTVDKKKGPIL